MAPDRRGARERVVSKTASPYPRQGKRPQIAVVYADSSDLKMNGSDTSNATQAKKMESQAKKEMKNRFTAIVKKAETLGQVAAASQWMTSMTCTPQDCLRFQTFNAHMRELKEHNVWPDIIQYRMIGQISTYFLPGQRLRNGKPDDINALDELEVSVCGWVRLASEGRLSRLEEFAGVENGEKRYKSVAERFKAFMDAYKRKGEYDIWTYDRMKVLRYDIYRVVHELDAEAERPMLPSSECIILFSAETSRFLTFNLVPSNGDQTLRSTEAERSFDEDQSRDSEGSSSSDNRRQRPSEASTEEDLYNATPMPRIRRPFSTSHRPAEPSRAAAPNSGQHMAEQAEPGSRTRGTARRQDPETDDRNLAKLQKRLVALDNSMSAKRSALEEAEEAVTAAQKENSDFSERILTSVREILKYVPAKGEKWTEKAVNMQLRQVDKFQELGELVRDALVTDLLEPLIAVRETQAAIDISQAERAELRKKLSDAKKRS
jgi:hypothetical protein